MVKIVSNILLVLFLSGCATATPHHQHDQWLGEDKVYHFFTASVIGAAATKVALNNHNAPCESVLIGISTTFVIGSGKEWYDMKVKKTLFSWKDMVWNMAGGTLGSFVVGEC